MAPGSPPAGFPEAGGGFPGEARRAARRPSSSGRTTASRTRNGSGGYPAAHAGPELPGPAAARVTRQALLRAGRRLRPGQRLRPTARQTATARTGRRTARTDGYGQATATADGLRPRRGYGQDGGYGQERRLRRPGLAAAGAADQADDVGSGGGQDNDGGWGRPAGRSAAPWDERGQQDAGYQDPDGQDFGQQDFGRQDYTRQAPRPSYAGPGLRGPGLPRPAGTRLAGDR